MTDFDEDSESRRADADIDTLDDTRYSPAETAVLAGMLDEAMGHDVDEADEGLEPEDQED